jgi:hypothetical protein
MTGDIHERQSRDGCREIWMRHHQPDAGVPDRFPGAVLNLSHGH